MPDHFSFDAIHLCQLPSIEVCELQLWFASSKGVGLKLHWKRWWGKCIVMLLLLQAAFIESLKACAGAPFFTCVVSVAYFSAGFVVEWEGWNFTDFLNSLHLCNDDGEVEQLNCQDCRKSFIAVRTLVSWYVPARFGSIDFNWKKTIYNETKQSSGFEQMMFELQCSNGAKPWTISKRSQT